MVTPLRTERLLLRGVRASDLEPLLARRNHPEVASLQSWPLPYTREQAQGAVDAMGQVAEPTSGEWFMFTIADVDDAEVFGDLALKLEWDGRAAEVGYTLAREHWGKGYASEALTALLDWLFDVVGVTRVAATLHPENLASARVVERCGFVFEGHTRNSYWVGDENSDDWLYGLTPELRAEWNGRPRHRPERVELVELEPAGLREVLALGVHHSQRRFVSPVSTSLAQVAVPPMEQGSEDDPDGPRAVPWPRVVLADGVAVGFVMLEEPTATEPEPYLWRLLIDRLHQGRGIGGQVLAMVCGQARAWGAESMTVSWAEGVGSPRPMYEAFGFVPTGEVDDGETVARLRFA